MQEHVKLGQNEAENDDIVNEQVDLERQKQMSEPVASVSGNINDDFVPMSMSSVNASVRDALVKMGETQLGCNSTSPGGNINGEKMISHPIEQSLSQVKSSTAGECKTSSHRSKRFVDDSKHKRSRTTFNVAQISALESIFKGQQYPDQPLREKIAERLEMEEHKVVIWFQNRRAKLKRNNANFKNTLVAAPIQDTNCPESVQTVEQQSVLGGNYKWESQHVNANNSYTVNQQNSFQDGCVPNSYHFDKPTQMLHGIPADTVCSSLQENYTFSSDTECVNDVRRNMVQLASDGFNSSPETVASSMDSTSDTGDVSSALKPIPTLKPDKPLIQEPPPNQICTNAGCQDEMRQALMQWRTKLNMAATSQQQTINSSTSFSSEISNTLQNNISAHVDRSSQFQNGVYEETCISSSSSSSCSESDEDENCLINQRNQQFPYKFHPSEHHQVDASNTQQYRTFNNAPALNQQNLLYLDIPSVSSSDMSSPAPHSTTSSASWLSSDLSSVDLSSPLSQLDNQKPVPPVNISGPLGLDWSSKCNEIPNKPTYISHVTNPYADDIFLPPLRRDVELPTQRSRRRLKWRRIRHEQRRKYPVRTNKHNKNTDKYTYYPGNMEMHNKRQDRCVSMEGMAHTGQREPFTTDNFMSVPCPNTTRSQCKYAQQDSTYHIEQQYERQKHYQRQSNGQSKHRHLYNHRLHYSGNPKYSQHNLPNQSMMPTTAEELRSATRLQKSDNGLDEYYSSSSNNNIGDVIPSKQTPLMNFNGGNSARDGKSLDQHRNRVPYPQATPEWNNPIMEVHVPVHHRRPKHPQPPREEKGTTSGVVHHYGDAAELDIPPFQVESVSDLSSSLNADQSAVLNRVLESVVKDIFPFSDNFISI